MARTGTRTSLNVRAQSWVHGRKHRPAQASRQGHVRAHTRHARSRPKARLSGLPATSAPRLRAPRAAGAPSPSAPRPLTWRRCRRARVPRAHPPGGPRVRARSRMAAPGAGEDPSRAQRGRRRARTLRPRGPSGVPPAPRRLGVPGQVRRPEAGRDAAAAATASAQPEARRSEQKPGEQAHGPPAPLHLTRISPPSPAPDRSSRKEGGFSAKRRGRGAEPPRAGWGRAFRPRYLRLRLGRRPAPSLKPLRRQPLGSQATAAGSSASGLETLNVSSHPAWVGARLGGDPQGRPAVGCRGGKETAGAQGSPAAGQLAGEGRGPRSKQVIRGLPRWGGAGTPSPCSPSPAPRSSPEITPCVQAHFPPWVCNFGRKLKAGSWEVRVSSTVGADVTGKWGDSSSPCLQSPQEPSRAAHRSSGAEFHPELWHLRRAEAERRP